MRQAGVTDSSVAINVSGWHRIKLSDCAVNPSAEKIGVWLKTSGTDYRFYRSWDVYYFEDEKDAVLFALMWS